MSSFSIMLLTLFGLLHLVLVYWVGVNNSCTNLITVYSNVQIFRLQCIVNWIWVARPWAGNSTFLNFSFLLCRMRVTSVPPYWIVVRIKSGNPWQAGSTGLACGWSKIILVILIIIIRFILSSHTRFYRN